MTVATPVPPAKPTTERPTRPRHSLRPVPLEKGAVEGTLRELIPDSEIKRIAKETGFIERERKIKPVPFFWALVLGFGVDLQRTLSGLYVAYTFWARLKHLTYAGYYLRFTPELVLFLQRCLELGLANLAQQQGQRLDPRLAKFAQDVLIKDSSVVRLHASLAVKFPATRSKKVAAGLKVDTLVSVCANGPKSVALVGERTADVKTLRVGSWVKGRILLADLGYYCHRLFARIHENGGFFVSREKENADPLFVRSLTVHRGRAIDLTGKHLSEVLPRLQRGVLDAEVEIALKRRAYRGTRSSDTFRCRLVAVWNEEARRYHVYLTNISPEQLSAEEVAQLYTLRWTIELTFKELKSSYALDKFQTKNEHVIKALILAALLTLVASRRLHNLVLEQSPVELRPRYTQLRWAKAFRSGSSFVLELMMAALGRRPWSKESHEMASSFLTEHALDPHVNRHRFREVWSR
jgi:putative transposase